jgi:hypothetical protein
MQLAVELCGAGVAGVVRAGQLAPRADCVTGHLDEPANLNPRAQSPNKLWYSCFQQHSSYPNGHNPNLTIADFFNRLDRHGGVSGTY